MFEEGPHFLDDRDFFLFFLSMTFSPVDRVCHAYIQYFFVFVPKKVADVTDFGLNSRKSLRKANFLFGYFRAFWLQSGIAGTELSRKKVRGQVLINILVDFIEKH
jgi:hypothetical protein